MFEEEKNKGLEFKLKWCQYTKALCKIRTNHCHFFIQSIDIANLLQYKMCTFWKQWEWFTGTYFQTLINYNKL